MSDESPETTDKGRPRPSGSGQTGSARTTTSAAKKAPAAKKTPAASSGPARTGADKTGADKTGADTAGSSTGRALTANDYAASTSNSASSTAVIPAVKDEPSSTSPTKSTKPAKTAPAPVQDNQLGGGAGRAATLRLSHVDPWSVTRMAFAISVALMVVAVVAVAIFWLVLEALGIWDTVDNSVTSVLSDDTTAFSITDYLGFGRLVGLTLVLSALNVIIATVLATIAAHLYNLAAQLLGGFQVTYTSQD